MPTKRVTMRKIKECLRLKFVCGLSHAQIARALGLSKGVVSKYVRQAERAGLDGESVVSLDEVEIETRLLPSAHPASAVSVLPEWSMVHQELRRKGMTLQLLWEEYVDAHSGAVTYSYSHFCHLYQAHVATLKCSMRQTHLAGEKLFIDYAGQTVTIEDATSGQSIKGHIFVAVLGASNYTFACATLGETRVDWLNSLIKAYAFFGGVTRLVIPDNPKALVDKADRHEPQVSRAAEDCARHYGTVMLPTRPRHPKDKAKVEVAVQIVERWILARLRRQRFFSLTELNRAIGPLLSDLNQRPFKKLPGHRQSWFESLDRPALLPLPEQAYELAEFTTCQVSLDYHVNVAGHNYSVPHALVRQIVETRSTAATVEIFLRGRRIACHPRSAQRGGHTTRVEHMPKSHQAHREWTPDSLRGWAQRIGPNCLALVHYQLTHKPHPEMGYRACLGVVALARRYDATRLEAACTRAVHLNTLTVHSLRSILRQALDRQSLPDDTTQADWISPPHGQIRGAGYYGSSL